MWERKRGKQTRCFSFKFLYLMVITKAFRMQFLICCGHDRKTKSQLGFSSCYFVSIQPVGNILLEKKNN